MLKDRIAKIEERLHRLELEVFREIADSYAEVDSNLQFVNSTTNNLVCLEHEIAIGIRKSLAYVLFTANMSDNHHNTIYCRASTPQELVKEINATITGEIHE